MNATTSHDAQSAPSAGFTDQYWWSHDGLRLHARDYAGPPDAGDLPPVLCIPGLTRNVRDFEGLAPDLAQHRRVLTINLRGRGESAYAKDALTYDPLIYVRDIVALLDTLDLSRVVIVGTSLGGLCALLLAATQPGRVAGVVFNDIGPTVEEAGIARIRSYVGTASNHPTWMHAARALSDQHGALFPDFGIDEWLVMAKRAHKLDSKGRIVADYDSNIAVPIRMAAQTGTATPDLWPTMAALTDVPTLVLRGGLSDILSEATVARMQGALPRMQAVTIPRVGHAPTLDEPEARAAITRFVAAITA